MEAKDETQNRLSALEKDMEALRDALWQLAVALGNHDFDAANAVLSAALNHR